MRHATPPAFPRHDDAWYETRLREPAIRTASGIGAGRVPVVIDTDCANEIDDQFALAWALLRSDVLNVRAVLAEPFSFAHRRADHPQAPFDAPPFNPPADGMARSHDEIVRVYELLGLPHTGRVFCGSTAYLPAPHTAVDSAAARRLIDLARAQPADEPLYVLALGCVTNIASALLLAPDIVNHLVVVWTSGYPTHAPQVNHSFNLEQDLWASQCLLDSGVPLVYLPGYHVGAQLRLSQLEVERFVKGCGAIGNYLHHLFTHNPLWAMLGEPPRPLDGQVYSWVIWDLICVAWLLDPAWVPTSLQRTPRLGDDRRWLPDASRPWLREGYAVQRDAVFRDVFGRLPSSDNRSS